MAVMESISDLKADHPELAEVFKAEWQTPLAQYSRNLYQKPARKLEPALIEAVLEELASMGIEMPVVEQAVDQLQRLPVLQTSHHITPTHGPTFLALDLICLSGLKDSELYLVGANSGVAFSNSAWSGALSYGNVPLASMIAPESRAFQQVSKSQQERTAHGDADRRISLIPAKYRDRLVFSTRQEEFQREIVHQFKTEFRAILPDPNPGQPFSHWAAAAATAIQNRVFGSRQILVFDINRVVARYLATVLAEDPGHPCSMLLSDSRAGSEIRAVFDDPVMFLGSYKGKKSDKVDPLTWSGSGLNSLKNGFQSLQKPDLIRKLSGNELCPGVFLLFFILRFLNGIRCLGSFNQVGYLEEFRRRWLAVDANLDLELTPDYRDSLTTGRLIDGRKEVWPLDLLIEGQQLSTASFAEKPMGSFWQPIVSQLTSSAR